MCGQKETERHLSFYHNALQWDVCRPILEFRILKVYVIKMFTFYSCLSRRTTWFQSFEQRDKELVNGVHFKF